MTVGPAQSPFLLRTLLIIAAGVWIYTPSLQGGWLMDDDFYITQNALLNDPGRLWKIWFAPGSLIEYYPIEATLQAIQWHFWHLDTLGYHLTNIILHIIGALLVWRLLEKFHLRLAWLGGFLFVVHPAAVESVAWISEFKNTLSLPPFLLAMIFWIDYDDQRRPRDYLLALGLFLVAMLCKVSMALFPFVLLLYAWWKRGRIDRHDLKTAAPFFLVSLVLGTTTVLVGNWFREAHLQSAANPDIGGWPQRIVQAGTSLLFYFTKCLLPVNMIPIYPKWSTDPDTPLAFAPLIVLGALAWFWIRRKTWGRHALLGVGFFLLNLLPFIGLNSVTFMGFTWVMDHFVYLPMIGLIGLAIAALENIEGDLSAATRPWLTAGVAVTLALLGWKSHAYAGVFDGPEALWTYTVAHNPTSWLPHNNLGNVLLETGRSPEAIAQYEEALRYNPDSVEAHTNLGFAFDQAGREADAIDQYGQALKYNPHFALAQAHLGNLLARTGHVREAIEHYEQAMLINPGDEATRAALEKLRKNPE